MHRTGDGREAVRAASVWRVILAFMICLGAAGLCGCFVSPDPFSDNDQWQRAVEDTASLFTGQEAPQTPVSLPEAIARAVKFNLDHKLSLMEAAFHVGQLDVANLAMLPRLAVNAGYSWRSNESASVSMSYRKRTQSLEPSFSTETTHLTSDLSLSWTLLDFGLSYFQARQQADRVMIMQERRRRIVNNLVKDVIADYFRVAAAERLQPEIEATVAKAEAALAVYRKLEEEKKGPLMVALEQQRTLVTIIGHLRQVSMQLAASKARLAALMNLPLSTDFTVVAPDDGDLQPPELLAGLDELETIGVYLRPDLREELYHARIDKYDVKKEILKMVPGVNLFTSMNTDNNRYLVHDVWAEAGARLSMDIIGLASKWKQVKSSKAREQVTRQRRLAATIAAMVQINMSYHQYLQAVELYNDSEHLKDIDGKLLEISRASARARESGALDEVRQAAVALNSRLDRDRYLVEALTAWSNLYFSIGGDLLGSATGAETVDDLARIASDSLAEWLAGTVPELPDAAAPVLTCGAICANQYADATSLPPVLTPPHAGAVENGDPAPTEKDGTLSKNRQPSDVAPAEPPVAAAVARRVRLKPDSAPTKRSGQKKPPANKAVKGAASEMKAPEERARAEVLLPDVASK